MFSYPEAKLNILLVKYLGNVQSLEMEFTDKISPPVNV